MSRPENQADQAGNVRVICRFRPLNEKEIKLNLGSTIEFPNSQTVKVLTAEKEGGYTFNFDAVFSPNAHQEEIYMAAAQPIIESVLQGFNGTVFAYGQTSSGKTHTMTGPSIVDPVNKGIIPRMINTVFDAIASAEEHLEYTVKVGYSEIYLERIRDLLNPA